MRLLHYCGADREARDRGGIIPLAAVLTMVLASGMAMAARLGGRAAAIARADTAAEAAALAAALSEDPAAAAKANGAVLISTRQYGDGPKFEAIIERGGIRAVAAAELGGPPGDSGVLGPEPTGDGGRRKGLAPATLAALGRADRLLVGAGVGAPVPIVSGYRSVAEQLVLWAQRATNPYPVAPPGHSAHNLGLAIDVPRSYVGPLLRVAREAGLCQPYPATDPIHFGPVESPECGGHASGANASGVSGAAGAYLVSDGAG